MECQLCPGTQVIIAWGLPVVPRRGKISLSLKGPITSLLPAPPPIKNFPVPGQGFQAELRHLQPALWSQILRPINSAGEKLLRSLGVPDRLRIQRGRDTPPSLNRKIRHLKKKKAPPRAGWRSLRRQPEEGSGVAAARGGRGSGPETRPTRRAPSLPCKPLGMLRWCGGGAERSSRDRRVATALPSGALGGPGGSSGGGTWW